MNIPLRIMLTGEQKKLIDEAASLDGSDVSAWIRPLLLRAAEERVEKAKKRRPPK